MRIICIGLFIFFAMPTNAQQVLDVAAPGETGGNYGTINYLDASRIGQKKVENLAYVDISGSPFWDESWNAAIFVLSNGNTAKVRKAKLNLYTNEVHFVNSNGIELVCENKDIKKIIFFKGMDTTKVLAVFESFLDASNTVNSYYHVLNTGRLRLLVLQKILINEKEYDPLSGKREHSFFPKTTYAISDNGNLLPLKSLDYSNIFFIVHSNANAQQWLKQNKNKLKNESEVVSFLNYCNTQQK